MAPEEARRLRGLRLVDHSDAHAPVTESDGNRVGPFILVLLTLVGTALLWEPLTGVFRRTVQFNAVGTGAFLAWAIVAALGFVASLRAWRADRSFTTKALVAVAGLLALLAGATWIVIIVTGAIGTGTPSSGVIDLQ